MVQRERIGANARTAFDAITESSDRLDMIDAALANDPIDSTLMAEPTEPIDSTDPTEPMQSTELRLPIDRSEFVEPMLQRDDELMALP
jgi:hypothetical protein